MAPSFFPAVKRCHSRRPRGPPWSSCHGRRRGPEKSMPPAVSATSMGCFIGLVGKNRKETMVDPSDHRGFTSIFSSSLWEVEPEICPAACCTLWVREFMVCDEGAKDRESMTIQYHFRICGICSILRFSTKPWCSTVQHPSLIDLFALCLGPSKARSSRSARCWCTWCQFHRCAISSSSWGPACVLRRHPGTSPDMGNLPENGSKSTQFERILIIFDLSKWQFCGAPHYWTILNTPIHSFMALQRITRGEQKPMVQTYVGAPQNLAAR